METASQLAQRIAHNIWSQLLEWREEPNFTQVYLQPRKNPKELTLTYQEVDDNDVPITDDKAKELILEYTIKHLNESGKVLLYTCGDNALVSIEDTNAVLENPETLDYLEEQDGFNQHYYIGFD